MIARVRPEVSGTVQHGNNFLPVVPGDEWPADHPCVAAYPEVFELVDDKPARKAKDSA